MMENLPYSNVLYLDDEVHNLNSFKACFRKEFKVFIAKSTEEALDILSKQQIHLIITDQRMPNCTGIEFLVSIIDKYPDTIRMLMTGYADIEAVIDSINKGRIFKYIQKPWNEEKLRETIREGLTLYAKNEEKKQFTEKLAESNEQIEFLLRQSLLS